MKAGSLHVVCGCMFSGKSAELTRLLRRASFANIRVFAFKPKVDTRASNVVRSRDGQAHEALTVDRAEEILAAVPDVGPGLVGIDEAQFFSPAIVGVVETLLQRGYEVVCAGLDTDFRGEPFGSMPQLLAIADDVTKLKAVCMKCLDLNATRSQLRPGVAAPSSDEPLVLIGDQESYEARCRSCHVPPDPVP